MITLKKYLKSLKITKYTDKRLVKFQQELKMIIYQTDSYNMTPLKAAQEFAHNYFQNPRKIIVTLILESTKGQTLESSL